MKKEFLHIGGIPAVLWGKASARGFLAVHGNCSSKTDVPIELLAKHALKKGYQVLSFDLPEHGDRKGEDMPCTVRNGVLDLQTVMAYAKRRWQEISLFGNSLGAYFSLLALGETDLQQAFFLSPVVDMEHIIENMMRWFQVSKERLEREGIVDTPIGQRLYWEDYCFVREHPIGDWKIPTSILYGEQDEVCERDTIDRFVKRFGCELRIVEGSEHYFHTAAQLEALEEWMRGKI